MRLRRLDLTRYGKFTDRSIDFGERVAGQPDLHIVYGPNEAGKSTAFAAYLDLLFGIGVKSRYNFLHAYATMQVGGCLELAAGARELVRIKSPAPTLRNAANEPVAEATILGDLGGLDRNAYRMMFSLDDDTLEAGGDSILQSRGELGQLLFAASAGLSDLSLMLAELKSQTEGFSKANARSGELAELKAELAAQKQARDGIDTFASEYNRLAAARDQAASHYKVAMAEHAGVKAQLGLVQRRLTAQPLMAAHTRFIERVAQFFDLPDAPRDWLDELPGLQRDESRHRSETERAGTEVVRLSDALASMTVDEAAEKRAGRLDLLKGLRVRYEGAELDLPKRRSEAATADGEVRAILLRLDRAQESQPARLLLNAAQSSVLGDAIARHSAVQAAVTAATDEMSRALHELTEARRAMHEDPEARADASLAPVKAGMDAVRDSDFAHRARNAAKARMQYADALAARLLALAPWQGLVEALAACPVPEAATADAWSASAGKAANLIQTRREDVERHETETARRAAELNAIGQTAGLVSGQEAAGIRSTRETAWAAHRRALDHATAEIFEAALRQDDIVSAARLGHERDLAKLHEAARGLAVQRAEAAHAAALLETAMAVHKAQAEAFACATTEIGLSPCAAVSPAWLPGWLARREKALESWHLLRQAEREETEAREDAACLRTRLIEALAQAGLPQDAGAPLDALTLAAQNAIDRQSKADLLGQAVTTAERDVRKRELAVQKAAQAEKAWQAAWRQACASCWFGEEAAGLPIATVRDMVAAATELAVAVKSKANLTGRIQDMEDDQAAFLRELEALVAELGVEAGRHSPLDLAQIILDRVRDATGAAQERQKLRDALTLAEDTQRQAEASARRHAVHAGEMMAAMGAASLIELHGKLRDAAEKAELQRQAAQAERDILSALHATSLAEAQALLASQAETELTIEAASLAAQLENLDERTRRLFAEASQAEDRIAAVGGDDAAVRIEERRRTIMLTIEDKARAYLRHRLGIAAAERALRAYRDQHRSAMLRQASEAFGIISRGAYRGLGTQPDKDGAGEVLIALAADGGSKLAVDLSKGTRFQLYLALRAAGYQEFAKQRPPVPFIADDIMETFDDFRAEETLRVLAGMARLGQVIYLTHHDHLRAIAERTVPGVRIHHLAS